MFGRVMIYPCKYLLIISQMTNRHLPETSNRLLRTAVAVAAAAAVVDNDDVEDDRLQKQTASTTLALTIRQ